MEKPDKKKKPDPRPSREISNARLFADEIVFSDTEKILFEEDLKDQDPAGREGLMDGNPETRYAAVKKLNEGGMKAIWEVDDRRTARKVAMALIQEGRIASKEDIDAFLYEARLTSNLQHPNIIPIYDIALDENGNPYFTMKALRGETLDDILRKLREGDTEYRKKYTRTHLLSIFLKVCDAIDYAHTKGVIHLDLKPSNVNVGNFGDVQVLDWGLSTLITHMEADPREPVSPQRIDEVEMEDGQTLTRYLETASRDRRQRNVVGGTPGYMAPEQARGSLSDVVFQTDVYMLGAMLYEILTYHCPVEGDIVKEVLQKTVRGEIPPAGKRAPERRIPSALEAIAMKALATDPADRYPTVSAMIRDLHQYQDGYATIAENPTFFTHLALLIKRHKMAVGLIAAFTAVIAAVLANSFIKIKQSEQVALEALAALEQKNEYIAETARTVAPDYLELAVRAEREYEFPEAEQALDTSLAFDPSLADGWLLKAKMLLARQRFAEAWALFSGAQGHPVTKDPPAYRLARKYRDAGRITDAELPQLVGDFVDHGISDSIPRLFYHLNRQAFDPATRFPALAESLEILNPEADAVDLKWQDMAESGWLVDIGDHPNLNDIAPLCGLRMLILNASRTGSPDTTLLTEEGLLELRLSGTGLNRLPELMHPDSLQVLDISHTRIRNIDRILQYPNLRALNISGISGLVVSPQLVWSQKLQMMTVSRELFNDPTVRTLARRGVVIIYADEQKPPNE